MPVLVVDGKQYRVPLMTLLKGNKSICEQLLAAKVTRLTFSRLFDH